MTKLVCGMFAARRQLLAAHQQSQALVRDHDYHPHQLIMGAQRYKLMKSTQRVAPPYNGSHARPSSQSAAHHDHPAEDAESEKPYMYMAIDHD